MSLSKGAMWCGSNPKKTLFFLIVVTAFMIYGVTGLKMDMSYFSILPDNSDRFRDLKKITRDFPLSTGIIAVIDASKNEEVLKGTVDEITASLSSPEFKPWVKSVFGKMDQDFISRHGLLLSEADDIKRITELYSEAGLVPFLRNLNNDFEREYGRNEDNLKEDETLMAEQLSSLMNLLTLMEKSLWEDVSSEEVDKAVSRYLTGEGYMLSKDGSKALVFILPAFAMEEVNKVMEGVGAIEDEIMSLCEQRGISAGLTGFMTVTRDEGAAASSGFMLSFILASLAIILLLVIIFRMRSVPLIIGIPLLTGILWTAGLAGFTVKRLNIVTSMYMVALLGLGVDYAIHLLTGFVMERDRGKSFLEALERTYREAGRGIITGALTTSAAFFALTISQTSMLRELGIIAGLGILCELLATLIFIPPLLALREKKLSSSRLKRLKVKTTLASGIGSLVHKRYSHIFILTLIIAGLFLLKAGDVSIETNLMEMEAKGLTSVKLQDQMVEDFQMAPDSLSVLSTSVEETRTLSKKLKKLSSVKSAESIAPYLISDEEYEKRKSVLLPFKNSLHQRELPEIHREELTQELQRLQWNLTEMSDLAFLGNVEKIVNTVNTLLGLDSEGNKITDSLFDRIKLPSRLTSSLLTFQENLEAAFSRQLITMADTTRVTEQMLPSWIRDSFISRDGSSYLINIVPRDNPWHEKFRKVFTAQIESVTTRATGMVLISDQLSDMAKTDGVKTTLAALVIVCILLLLDFRNLKLTLFTITPLLLSFTGLFALMALFKIDFDFVNIIAIPLLIGIGIDDTVHINHRYLNEGKGKMKEVITKAGSAVMLTSITTTIGFASFIPSPMRGISGTGIVLSAAILLAFTFSVLFYPSLLIIAVEKAGLNIYSGGKK